MAGAMLRLVFSGMETFILVRNRSERSYLSGEIKTDSVLKSLCEELIPVTARLACRAHPEWWLEFARQQR